MPDSLEFLREMEVEIKKLRRRRLFISTYHKLIGRDRLREVTRLGIHWNLKYKGFGGSFIKTANHEYKSKRYFFTQAHERHCDVCIDAGANVGFYTMLAAKSRLFSEIHCFEPHPETFRQLQWHIDANGFGNEIVAYQKALGDSCGTIKISDVQEHDTNRVVDASNDGVSVESATLDSLFDMQGRRLAMKLDIEGHETLALRGAEKLLANNDVFLQVEVLPKDSERSALKYLFEQGFDMLFHADGRNFYFWRERVASASAE